MGKITFTDTLNFENRSTGNTALSIDESGANIVQMDGRQLLIQDTAPSNPSDGDVWIKG